MMPRILLARLLRTTSTKPQSFQLTLSLLLLPMLPCDVISPFLSVLIMMKARSRLTCLVVVVTLPPQNYMAKLHSNTKQITSESSKKRETLIIHVGTPNFGMPIWTRWAACFSAFGMHPACFIWLSVTKIQKNGCANPVENGSKSHSYKIQQFKTYLSGKFKKSGICPSW
jgi:hypothetical protein